MNKARTAYVPLSVNFFEDEKVLEVMERQPLAVVLFFAALTVCKRNLSDGRVRLSQLRRECAGIKRLPQLATTLVEVGLFSQVDDQTYTVTSYLNWNESRAENEERRRVLAERGRAGGKAGSQAGSQADCLASGQASDRTGQEDKRKDNDQTHPGEHPAGSSDGSRAERRRLVEDLFVSRALGRAPNIESTTANYKRGILRNFRVEHEDELNRLLDISPPLPTERIVTDLEQRFSVGPETRSPLRTPRKVATL